MLGFLLGAFVGYFLKKVKTVTILVIGYLLLVLLAVLLDVGKVNVLAFFEQGAGLYVGVFVRSYFDKKKAKKLEEERLLKKTEQEKKEAEKKEKKSETVQDTAPIVIKVEEEQSELPDLDNWKE
ncbi:hypothetical protein A2380_04155 [candidate division WWE3 bacterium RIFOXYB1_FULL_43_24]|uniref:Uncharacterized protein n=2 Tax=Katanobacteria TaxID=422282 RepID=A0A0G1ASS4_UNCKA|nr:MAG: hypothetical protein UV00_C0017G0004 [candidate division WWE3 bacterium GW2011_GWF1_42_14]KKS39560.1 MAG: hypothetical protein UV03_C0029G0005 [candidate division WWE3 bacterium GW2011_GWE1_42_16]KKS65227.1 MAG: hypothetical protein UV35_C0047G0003 [candidate division WWE3 bacterium GW2011_GWB1_42_6]OGC59941.1 MAG: hypothetical protein A2212_02870 [candidate division WWE3 bacterium RIFOXYA1_FULL_42_9]OGC69101.1 MAG: hypothetical protein A2380_04155 [candidate division WWE3 bacterium RIF